MSILKAIPIGDMAHLARRLGAAIVVYVGLHFLGLHTFMAKDTEGLHELTQITGDIYAVLLAFVVFVVWGQFTELENLIIKEANTLDDVRRFVSRLGPDVAMEIKAGLGKYLDLAVREEWEALGEGRRSESTDEAFDQVLRKILKIVPKNDVERALYERLLDITDRLTSVRDERTAKSLTRMPPTLLALIKTLSAVLLGLMYVYPFSHLFVGIAMLSTLALVLFLAEFVVRDTDNPLKGVWNVSKKPFTELQR